MQNYETRKQLEASIQNIADLHNFKRDELRNSLKWYLINNGVIFSSTTELSDGDLKYIADSFSDFAFRMENTPPAERGNAIDFKTLIPLIYASIPVHKPGHKIKTNTKRKSRVSDDSNAGRVVHPDHRRDFEKAFLDGQ